MQLEYFCVAESASVDQESNQVSLFNVLEEIGAQQFPVVMSHLVAVAVVLVEPNDHQKKWEAGIVLHRPGEGPDIFPIPLDIAEGTRRHRIMQRVVGLPLKQEGELVVELTLNGAHLAKHTATVRLPNKIELARFAQAQKAGTVVKG